MMKKLYVIPQTELVRFDNGETTMGGGFTNMTDASNPGGPGTPGAPERGTRIGATLYV